MDGNVGMVDRWIRGLLGIGLLALWWFAIVQGTLAVVLAIVGAALLTLGLVVSAVPVWLKGYWSIWGRLHYSLVVLAAVALTGWMRYWQLLGI